MILSLSAGFNLVFADKAGPEDGEGIQTPEKLAMIISLSAGFQSCFASQGPAPDG
jgi:hypothetical protein